MNGPVDSINAEVWSANGSESLNGNLLSTGEVVGNSPHREVPRPFDPEQSIPRADFIDSYAVYADVLEVPRSMHEAVAIQVVASILNRNGVLIPHGNSSMPLDLWVLLLSGSGCGRSTLIGLVRPILQAAQIEDLIRDTQWGSPEALYQDMAENPQGLFIWGEFSEKMKMLNDPRFGGAKEWLTDRYDNLVVPEARKYRHTGKAQDTPTIVFSTAPRVNVLATSSDAWFFSHLSQEDSSGGFIPRWIIARAHGPNKDVAMPRSPDSELLPPLVSGLVEIAKLQGTADLSRIIPLQEKWYSSAKSRFRDQPNSSLSMPYFNRHRAQILKLAVVLEASRSGTLLVTPESWERAVQFSKMIEETIFSMLATGMNAEGYALSQMELKIRQAGANGLSLARLTRTFQHVNAIERRNRLSTLLESGMVTERDGPSTGGRKARIFVHADYIRQSDKLPLRKTANSECAAISTPIPQSQNKPP